MKTVVIGSGKLSIEDVVAIAKKQVAVELDSSAEFQRKIDSGAEFLDEALAEHGGIYGVTTGYGQRDMVIPARRCCRRNITANFRLT